MENKKKQFKYKGLFDELIWPMQRKQIFDDVSDKNKFYKNLD